MGRRDVDPDAETRGRRSEIIADVWCVGGAVECKCSLRDRSRT
jgi:hypothetical protein